MPARASTRHYTAPPGTLIYGHHDAFVADKLGFLERTAREHGDIVPLRFGPIRFWLVTDPALIGEVFTTRAASFRKDIGLRRSRVLLGESLLTTDGAEHARRSRIAQPSFRQKEVEHYADAMVEVARAVVDSWPDGGEIDLARELTRLTLDVVARALFGAEVDGRAAQVGAAITELIGLLDERVNRLVPIPLAIPTAANRRFNTAKTVLDDLVLDMIRARRGREPGAADDLLSRLLAARDPEGGHGLTDLQLRDEVMTLFLAGHETTANALAFTFYLLARHPEIAARVRAEVDATLAGGRPAEAHDLARLPLVSECFQESLRLYPPAWAMGREAAEPVDLGDGRLRVERGEIVITSPFVLHRDPRFWDEPLAFRPQRFAPDAPRPAPFTYFPFGIGKRACIGRSFALLEGALVTATILRRVDLEVDAPPDLPLTAFITLRPANGLRARVRRRRV